MLSAVRAHMGSQVTGLVPLALGHSNLTYVLEGVDRILRMPPDGPGLLPVYDMQRQHDVLAELGRTPGAPPVPEVRELCLRPEVLGRPFLVMDRLAGEAFEKDLPGWVVDADSATRGAVWFQWIDAVADLHLLAPLRALGEPVTPEAAVQRWLDVLQRFDAPELSSIAAGLRRRPPEPSGPSAPVHGDPKIGNCLWHDGRLAALLDWELAYNGDPLADLGYVLSLWFPYFGGPAQPGFDLPGVPDRDTVIERWETRTGRTARDVLWHEAAAHVKIAAILLLGAELHQRGHADDPRLARWGEVAMACTRSAAQLLAA